MNKLPENAKQKFDLNTHTKAIVDLATRETSQKPTKQQTPPKKK